MCLELRQLLKHLFEFSWLKRVEGKLHLPQFDKNKTSKCLDPLGIKIWISSPRTWILNRAFLSSQSLTLRRGTARSVPSQALGPEGRSHRSSLGRRGPESGCPTYTLRQISSSGRSNGYTHRGWSQTTRCKSWFYHLLAVWPTSFGPQCPHL